jgi:hypothetical protein
MQLGRYLRAGTADSVNLNISRVFKSSEDFASLLLFLL